MNSIGRLWTLPGIFALIACGQMDAGVAMDATSEPVSLLSLENGCPPSEGNSEGVGKPCMKGGDQCNGTPSPYCTADLASDAAYSFCTKACLLNANCGDGASCITHPDKPSIKGCIPNVCIPEINKGVVRTTHGAFMCNMSPADEVNAQLAMIQSEFKNVKDSADCAALHAKLLKDRQQLKLQEQWLALQSTPAFVRLQSAQAKFQALGCTAVQTLPIPGCDEATTEIKDAAGKVGASDAWHKLTDSDGFTTLKDAYEKMRALECIE